MKSSLKLASVFAIGLFLAGFAVTGTASETERQSGFLGDYSKLRETKDASGDKVMRYENPKGKSGTYHAVMLDRIQYYPAPQPTDQVSAQTLVEIAEYMDKGLHEKLGSKVKMVTEPGPGVLRMRPAITAVAPQTPALKPYQYVPIAFVVSSVAGRGKEATIQIETQILDSVTGELMGASVRQGTGAKLANEKAQLKLEDLQPLLDKWIEAGTSLLADRMK